MFFEMRFDLGTLDSGEQSLPFGLLVFLPELPPFLELCPFEKIGMKSFQQDISKNNLARGLKLGQLTGDDE